ncbi:MAG: hypothetical protein Q8M07_23125 [Prosthecobacter sp.]|nr:hypothetical protein [Prosthecobacter sp.]
MNTRLLTLCLAAATSLTLADTPAAILKDYRTRATAATKRLDETLVKQGAQIVTNLVRSGDTAGAEVVTTQMKQIAAGEAIPAPHSAAAQLFTQYSTARNEALKPVQAAALARLDSLLKVAGGANLEDLQVITKTRVEIEAGKITEPPAVPLKWTYHQTLTSNSAADILMKPDGVFEINDGSGPQFGKWQAKGDGFEIEMDKYVWQVTVVDGVGTIKREVGTRYMKVKGKGR